MRAMAGGGGVWRVATETVLDCTDSKSLSSTLDAHQVLRTIVNKRSSLVVGHADKDELLSGRGDGVQRQGVGAIVAFEVVKNVARSARALAKDDIIAVEDNQTFFLASSSGRVGRGDGRQGRQIRTGWESVSAEQASSSRDAE